MTLPARYGITFPFDGIPLLEQRELVRELVDLGYTDLWSAESGGYDAFIPLAVAAQWAPELRLGTAIVPAYTRGAHTLASTVASMCQAAPGRFAFGIGQALGQRAGGNSLDNTLRVARRVPTDWVLADVRVHAVAEGFGHGLVHLWAEDGTLLGTASQSTIVRVHQPVDDDPLTELEGSLDPEHGGPGADPNARSV